MIGKVLYHALTTDSSINGIIQGRIYPNRPPQGTLLPCILYASQASPTTKTQDGSSHLKETVVIGVVAKEEDEVFNLAEKLVKRLHFYEGTFDNTTIDFMTFEDYEDDFLDELRVPIRELTFTVLSTITKQ